MPKGPKSGGDRLSSDIVLQMESVFSVAWVAKLGSQAPMPAGRFS